LDFNANILAIQRVVTLCFVHIRVGEYSKYIFRGLYSANLAGHKMVNVTIYDEAPTLKVTSLIFPATESESSVNVISTHCCISIKICAYLTVFISVNSKSVSFSLVLFFLLPNYATFICAAYAKCCDLRNCSAVVNAKFLPSVSLSTDDASMFMLSFCPYVKRTLFFSLSLTPLFTFTDSIYR